MLKFIFQKNARGRKAYLAHQIFGKSKVKTFRQMLLTMLFSSL